VFGGLFAGFAIFGWLVAFALSFLWNLVSQDSDQMGREARLSLKRSNRQPAAVAGMPTTHLAAMAKSSLAPQLQGRGLVTNSLEKQYWEVLSKWGAEGVSAEVAARIESQCRGNFQTPRCDQARDSLVREIRQNLKGIRASLFECELADVYYRAGSKVISCATAISGSEADFPQPVVLILERSCRSGDGKSCFAVGHRHFRLYNDLQAQHYFQSGCSLGDTKACFALGELWRWQGKLDVALPLMRKACGQTDRWQAMACFAQASIEIELYHNRRAAEQNLRISCGLGEPAGCYQLAALLMEDSQRRDREAQSILAKGCFEQRGVFGFNPLPCWYLIEVRKAYYGGAGIAQVVAFMQDSHLYQGPDAITLKTAGGDLEMAKLVSMMAQDMKGFRLYSCGRAYQTLMAFGGGPQEFGVAADACRSLVEADKRLRYERREQGIFHNYARFQ